MKISNGKAEKPIIPGLYAMEVGDVETWPADKAGAVQATASNYGFAWGRRYKTRRNRERMVIEVTRVY